MHSSTPGFPVPDRFPKFAQVCVHLVGDVIQPSHPLEFLKNDYLHKGNNIFQDIHGSGFFFFAFPFLYCPFFPLMLQPDIRPFMTKISWNTRGLLFSLWFAFLVQRDKTWGPRLGRRGDVVAEGEGPLLPWPQG